MLDTPTNFEFIHTIDYFKHKKIDSIKLLAGDASNRMYFRVKIVNDSYVVCYDSTQNGIEKFIRLQQLFKRNSIRVPEIYESSSFNHYMVLEDLGDKTLLQEICKLDSSEIEKIYVNIVDIAGAINRVRPEAKDQITEFFDFNKLFSEIQQTEKYFFRSFLKNTNQNLVDRIVQNLEVICKELGDSQDKVFCHRDFHSRNIMSHNNSKVIIDFQDARWGNPQYDLVSLLDDCYFRFDESFKNKLIKHYWSANSKIFTLGTLSDFTHQYEQVKIQRLLKAIGSFAYISSTKNDHRYLKYIDSVMNNILTDTGNFKSLKNDLKEFYYAD